MFVLHDLHFFCAASATHLIWFYRDEFQGKYDLDFNSKTLFQIAPKISTSQQCPQMPSSKSALIIEDEEKVNAY
jgi:hypothetical protein